MAALPVGCFLACYDYGMGGLWWVIRAASSAHIERVAPALTVFDAVPDWMDLFQWDLIMGRGVQDIANPTDPVLVMVIAEPS